MRHTAILRAFCSECGAKLAIPYDPKAGVKLADSWEHGDETGAAIRYLPLIVEPCKSCIDRHTAPAKAMAQAVRMMSAAPPNHQD